MEKAKIEWDALLGYGEDQAISMQLLTERLGFRTARQTRYAVVDARMNGVPICSLQNGKNTGYFLAKKPEEIQHTMGELRKRAYTSLRQASRLNEWMKMHGGSGINEQMTIRDFLKQESGERY